jgi:hypothetical protein
LGEERERERGQNQKEKEKEKEASPADIIRSRRNEGGSLGEGGKRAERATPSLKLRRAKKEEGKFNNRENLTNINTVAGSSSSYRLITV